MPNGKHVSHETFFPNEEHASTDTQQSKSNADHTVAKAPPLTTKHRCTFAPVFSRKLYRSQTFSFYTDLIAQYFKGLKQTFRGPYMVHWQDPGLNFINVPFTAFGSADPRIVKKTVKFQIFFTYLGSTSIKASRKTLMKLTPGPNLIKHLGAYLGA